MVKVALHLNELIYDEGKNIQIDVFDSVDFDYALRNKFRVDYHIHIGTTHKEALRPRYGP